MSYSMTSHGRRNYYSIVIRTNVKVNKTYQWQLDVQFLVCVAPWTNILHLLVG